MKPGTVKLYMPDSHWNEWFDKLKDLVHKVDGKVLFKSFQAEPYIHPDGSKWWKAELVFTEAPPFVKVIPEALGRADFKKELGLE